MDVLIIEDDAQLRRTYTKILERAGFMVAAVDNGLAGFAELQRQTFRTIMCDIQMPYLGGKGFYQQLEEAFPPMASRVVFVTAWAGDEKSRRFLEQTGQPFLRKPVEVAELVNAVREMVEKPVDWEPKGDVANGAHPRG